MPSSLSYQEALDAFLSFADFERWGRSAYRPDLAPMLSLLNVLGHPQRGRITVHVAGSKGKGSTAAMIASILARAGIPTGLYTSPHLDSFCERVRFNGQLISHEEFASLAQDVLEGAKEVERICPQRQLVTFDLLTALAFLAFRRWDVTVQVIEVGLGGRLDSTNVFTEKELSVITPIGLEHTAILGPTPGVIAGEKAEIIFGPGPAVLAPQYYVEATEVIAAVAAGRGVSVVDVASRYRWQRLWASAHGQRFLLEGPNGPLDLFLPLIGAHQMENAATAIASIHVLAQIGLHIPQEAIREGLANLSWPARVEVISLQPLIIVDGAHNRESARRLRQAIQDDLACENAVLVVGTLADKDIGSIAEELAPITCMVYATSFPHPRAMDSEKVAAAFARLGLSTQVTKDLHQALKGALEAIARINKTCVICLTGSLAFAAEGRRAALEKLKNGQSPRT